jgi:hypothetical protein
LFGHEFDTPEFASNLSLTNAMKKVFGKRVVPGAFDNARKRPDLLVLEDATISGVATEEVNDQTGLATIRDVLLVELKRGGSEITRENVHQASDYIEDILRSGLLDGPPHFRAFVVGHSINPKIEPSRTIGDPEIGKLDVVTYDRLVRSAQRRLFRLRERLTNRYEEVTGTDLLSKVLSTPTQLPLDSNKMH